jgi:hypothetical protein
MLDRSHKAKKKIDPFAFPSLLTGDASITYEFENKPIVFRYLY